ncbi:MAG TPA: malectin domain-containing carbohydrate-binding protein [Phycisphaerae bacterium]|nr:malectin domain-containing carbohydrate-binding protein [Phycisphaerae bacterium]
MSIRRMVIGALMGLVGLQGGWAMADHPVIVTSDRPTAREKLAASEVRRYIYLRTGELLDVVRSKPDGQDCILIGGDTRGLAPQEYVLKTTRQDGRTILTIAGGDDVGTLYGAYRFAEHLGVRFYLDGDVMPDERIPLKLPDVDEEGSPLFELRGIQPFHDFPEGPDWWDLDMYQAVISQLPKLRMNFIGFHTYPEGTAGPEPMVWIGPPSDVGEDGRVKASYPARHFSTLSGTWGFVPKETSKYLFGAATLFDDDAYSQDMQRGMNPWPTTPEACNELFNRFGEKLRVAFTHARSLGVKTCIGTETPLIAPAVVRQRLEPGEPVFRAIGGKTADYGSPIEGTDEDVVYQSVRWDLQAYKLNLPNGAYDVTLKFCEIAHGRPGARVFSVKLQGKPVIQSLDIFARVGKNRALDFDFANVRVEDGTLLIEFVPEVEYPCIAGIVVEGPETVKINCGSSKSFKDYVGDADKPLPPEAIEQLYAGMFLRIMRTHPLDYYWLWTSEHWTWSGVSAEAVRRTMDDLRTAVAAARKVNAPFELATCGWVLGPQSDRALFDRELPKSMAVSCINRAVGHDPVEPAFANVQGRGKWAIPWLEDDPAMISPQLWVGRMRKDAADAKAYGCTGLMGIHWRTRVLGPNVAALAAAAWDQSSWPVASMRTAGAVGGAVKTYADRRIEGTQEAPVYQSQRTGLQSYCLPAPNGTHGVTLKFCELEHVERGQRVFTIKLQGEPVLERFDIFAEAGPAKALDKRFEGVKVTDGWLVIEFVPIVGEPCLAGLVDNGPYGAQMINCGGPAWQMYAADPQPRQTTGRYLPVADFYRDWAGHSFGPEVAEEAAAVFARLDGNLPRPSNWMSGPGGIFPDGRRWEQVLPEYAFVDELEALRPRVKGAGNLERFDYWLNTLRYLRANGRLDCLMARQNQLMEELKKQPDDAARRAFAREKVLPVRIEVVQAVREVYEHLLATVTNASEMGTIANWEQHSLPGLLDGPGEELAQALGEPLPPEATPSQVYSGAGRLIVPAVRTAAARGETLKLKIIVLDSKPGTPVVYWRAMGRGEFQPVAATHRARGVYEAVFPPRGLNGDIEYYVEVSAAKGGTLRFPVTAPQLNQTVIVAE